MWTTGTWAHLSVAMETENLAAEQELATACRKSNLGGFLSSFVT
jgi:hypothetical protein